MHAGNCCLDYISLLGLELALDGRGRKSVRVKDWASRAFFLFLVILVLVSVSLPSVSAGLKCMYTAFKSGSWETVLQEGPCLPSRISQTRFFSYIRDEMSLTSTQLIFPIVISSALSEGTNSQVRILMYFLGLSRKLY